MAVSTGDAKHGCSISQPPQLRPLSFCVARFRREVADSYFGRHAMPSIDSTMRSGTPAPTPEQSAPLLALLEAWLREERSRLSRSASVTKPIDYMLKRWGRFARFIDDGRICLTNNAAERALRGFALGRKSWLFAGSERGADRAAVMATLIVTAKLNDIDPQAWLADVLTRINDHAIHGSTNCCPGTGPSQWSVVK